MANRDRPSYSRRNPDKDPRVEHLRIPPQSIEAEQAVLGGLMLVPESYDLVADVITDADFYRRDHQLIYRSIQELADKGKPYDSVTMGEWFEAQGLSEQVAGGAYLVELASTTPSAANIRAYASIVRDKSILRSLIEVSSSIVNDAFMPDGRDTSEILGTAEHNLLAIGDKGILPGSEAARPVDYLTEAVDLLQHYCDNRGELSGTTTGLTDLDSNTSGLQDSDLIILAARPSMGKTALALNIAEAFALKAKNKKPVAVFSMEMNKRQLGLRLLSAAGRVSGTKMRNGTLDDEEWPKITEAASQLLRSGILIDDTPALSPEALRARARRLKRQHDIGLVVVDYLQLMTIPGTTENRATEISAISRGLKALAKELNVPVLALSQLNRSLETRTDKRPVMADLRESGAIEQDADLILFIYRDEYYNKDSADKGLAEIIIGKQRNGPTTSFKVKFFPEYTRFDNLSHGYEDF